LGLLHRGHRKQEERVVGGISGLVRRTSVKSQGVTEPGTPECAYKDMRKLGSLTRKFKLSNVTGVVAALRSNKVKVRDHYK